MADAITAEQAQQAIEADKQARVKRAAEAIQAALRDNACDIAAVPQITPDGRISAVVQVAAR